MYPAQDPRADLERWEDEGGVIGEGTAGASPGGMPVRHEPPPSWRPDP